MNDLSESPKRPVSVDDWHRLIASKSECHLDEIKKTLDKFGIYPQATLPIRKAFHFHTLKFLGAKVGTQNDGEFSFEWDDLGAGLYGVLSEDNLVGKSSILRLLYGVLRGDFSGVSETVMGWINSLYTKFSVGEVYFELQLLRNDNQLKAILTRSTKSTTIEEYSGQISGLSAVIDQLLMKELEFDRLFATKEGNSLVSHGWPALASALFVSGSEGAVIGDLTLAGLPQRLLQLFIGLPWISTQSRASAILKIEENSKKGEQVENASNSTVFNAISRLKKQLDELPDTKQFENARKADRTHQAFLENKIDNNIINIKQINIDLASVKTEKSILETELLKLRRLKKSMEDDKSAGFVFRKLQPVCCPSCESTDFKLENLNTNIKNQCPLCKTDEPTNDLVDNSKIAELQEEIELINEKIGSLSREQNINSDRLSSVKEEIELNKGDLKEIVIKMSLSNSLEAPLARRSALEKAIEELELIPEWEKAEEQTHSSDIDILKAIVSQTKNMYQEKEAELFNDASILLKETASTLGVKHLVSISWTSTSLKIKIANRDTTYSKLSSGEKLRFRIAASVTIAKLAASTGQGRHPGILFFDSPKSEEITDSDFQEIMSAITQLTKDDCDLQIFVASRVPTGYEAKSLFKDTKHAIGVDFLF